MTVEPGIESVEVDALGLLCPLPILRAEAALKRARAARELLLWSDDEGILVDLPQWCDGSGHRLIEIVRSTHPSGRKAWRARVHAGGR